MYGLFGLSPVVDIMGTFTSKSFEAEVQGDVCECIFRRLNPGND